MKKLLPCLACFSLSAMLVAAQGDKTDAAKIQGTWTAVGGVIDGKKLAAEDVAKVNLRVLIKDGKYKVLMHKDNDKDKEVENGAYKLDAAKKPPTLDLIIGKGSKDEGKTQLALYKLEGDTLTVAIAGVDAKERPKNFDGGAGVEVTILKRGK